MAFEDLERLQSILECPRCESPLLFSGQEAHCPQCPQEIRIMGRCMVFIDDDLPGDFDQPDYVSSNPYTWNSLQLIEENKKGIVLDLGAGQPDHDFLNVVQVEIRKYPATDIEFIKKNPDIKQRGHELLPSIRISRTSWQSCCVSAPRRKRSWLQVLKLLPKKTQAQPAASGSGRASGEKTFLSYRRTGCCSGANNYSF